MSLETRLSDVMIANYCAMVNIHVKERKIIIKKLAINN